jgi:hypothetical protein
MVEKFILNMQDGLKTTSGIGYHIAILGLSAGIAFSLPWVAGHLLDEWSAVTNGKISLFSIEVGVAVVLIIFFNFIRQSYRDRQLARMASWAGFVSFTPGGGVRPRKKVRMLKEEYGRGRAVKVLGSSGHATLTDQIGGLSDLLGNCLGAQILLMNPFSAEASRRVQAVGDPHFTLESFREEVMQSIQLLKRLKTKGKNVKLKLYSEPPLFKLVILDDYLWLQHYHSDLDVQRMPEFVFQDHRNHQGLYTAFYQYFDQKWENHETPEYDLETDELIYRGVNGRVSRRVPFPPTAGMRWPMNNEGETKDRVLPSGDRSLRVREENWGEAS